MLKKYPHLVIKSNGLCIFPLHIFFGWDLFNYLSVQLWFRQSNLGKSLLRLLLVSLGFWKVKNVLPCLFWPCAYINTKESEFDGLFWSPCLSYFALFPSCPLSLSLFLSLFLSLSKRVLSHSQRKINGWNHNF